MGKRHKNLFGQIVAMENLRAALALTSRGKRGTYAYLFRSLNLNPLKT